MPRYSFTHWNNLPPEQQLQLHESLDRLAANNPDIVEQLQRLADLKENNPQQWEMAVKLLMQKK